MLLKLLVYTTYTSSNLSTPPHREVHSTTWVCNLLVVDANIHQRVRFRWQVTITACVCQYITVDRSQLRVTIIWYRHYMYFIAHDYRLVGIANGHHQAHLRQRMITVLKSCWTCYNSISIIYQSCETSSGLCFSCILLSFDTIMLRLFIDLSLDIIQRTCDLKLPFISIKTFFSPVSWCCTWMMQQLKSVIHRASSFLTFKSTQLTKCSRDRLVLFYYMHATIFCIPQCYDLL